MNKFEILKQSLDLESNPIGVKLIYKHDKNSINNPLFKEASRFEVCCEYVRRTSKGEFLIIKKGHFACHYAEVMLGFEESDNLELSMKLDIKGLKKILLFPINKFYHEGFDSIMLSVSIQKKIR
jgi:uncharacterized protein (DUF169 family)